MKYEMQILHLKKINSRLTLFLKKKYQHFFYLTVNNKDFIYVVHKTERRGSVKFKTIKINK